MEDLSFLRYFAKPGAVLVTCVPSFNPYIAVTISPVFTDEENESPGRLSDLHKVTQLVIGSAQSLCSLNVSTV